MLEKALQLIKTNLDEFENDGHDLKQMSDSLDIIAEKLLEINNSKEYSLLQNKISSILQSINTLSEQLNSTEKTLLNDSRAIIKDVKDEIELVIIGMNNINHFVNEVINGNDRSAEKLELRLDTLERKNNITNWLIGSLILITIAELVLFFGL